MEVHRERGLLLNFGAPSLQFKRLVRTPSENLRNLRTTLKKSFYENIDTRTN